LEAAAAALDAGAGAELAGADAPPQAASIRLAAKLRPKIPER